MGRRPVPTPAAVVVVWLMACAPSWAQAIQHPPRGTVAQIPTCTDGKPRLFGVTDGNSATDCATGGGSTDVICECKDGAWSAIAGGGGSGDITAVGDCATGSCFQSVGQRFAFLGPTGASGQAAFRAITEADVSDLAHTVDTTCLDAGVACLFAASVSEGGSATTATALAANGGNCAAGQWAAGVDASGAAEGCTADDDQPDSDAEVPDAITVSGGTVTGSAITLDTGVNPTADGQIRWDSTTERIEVGDDGVATLEFYAGAHTTDTGPAPDCSGTDTYQDGEGGCDTVGGDASGGLDALVVANDSHEHTAASTSALDAADLTTGTIPAARVGADHIDALAEIAAALRTGTDAKLVTGTAGTTDECGKWNADGDLVTSGGACVQAATCSGATPVMKAVSSAGVVTCAAPAAKLDADGDGTFEVSCDGTNCDFDINDDGTRDYRLGQFELEVGFRHVNTGSNTGAKIRAATPSVLTYGFEETGLGRPAPNQIGFYVASALKGRMQAEGLKIESALIADPASLTCTDSGDGSPGALTITPTKSVALLTVNDADGCTVTMGETGMVSGWQFQVVNVSANSATFADTAGVSELAGGLTAGQYDSITLLYASDRWVELSRSDN